MTILLNLKGVTCFLVFFFQMSMQEQLRILNYNSATKKKKRRKKLHNKLKLPNNRVKD